MPLTLRDASLYLAFFSQQWLRPSATFCLPVHTFQSTCDCCRLNKFTFIFPWVTANGICPTGKKPAFESSDHTWMIHRRTDGVTYRWKMTGKPVGHRHWTASLYSWVSHFQSLSHKPIVDCIKEIFKASRGIWVIIFCVINGMFPAPISSGSRGRYRSKRAVRRPKELSTHIVTHWTKGKIAIVCCGVIVLAMTTVIPILLLESSMSSSSSSSSSGSEQMPVSLHGLVQKSIEVEEDYKNRGLNFFKDATDKFRDALHVEIPVDPINHPVKTTKPQKTTEPKEKSDSKQKKIHPNDSFNGSKKLQSPSQKNNPSLLSTTAKKTKKQQLPRGVSGLPMSRTPALLGARPGHIDCDEDVDDIAYWNDPQGDRDRNFVSPFATPSEHYLTFEPDMGGWNNIRMSMEIIFVLAAVTGRTLVLPPKSPFYLLGMGKQNARSFGNFFPLDHPDFKNKVKIMTMEDFLEKERHGLLNIPDEEYEKIKPVADACVHTKDSPINCLVLYEFLREVGVQPGMEGMKNCLIFDLDHFQGKEMSADAKNRTLRFCGEKRTPVYYDDEIHHPQLIHWNAGGHEHRLLNHFYAFMFFTDPKIDNFYKRFVRDFLHYKDNIYCAAVSTKWYFVE